MANRLPALWWLHRYTVAAWFLALVLAWSMSPGALYAAPCGLVAVPPAPLVLVPVPADTTRQPCRTDLQRKMLPASRWPASGAYLDFSRRPRRARQSALDSAAAAVRGSRP